MNYRLRKKERKLGIVERERKERGRGREKMEEVNTR